MINKLGFWKGMCTTAQTWEKRNRCEKREELMKVHKYVDAYGVGFVEPVSRDLSDRKLTQTKKKKKKNT